MKIKIDDENKNKNLITIFINPPKIQIRNYNKSHDFRR